MIRRERFALFFLVVDPLNRGTWIFLQIAIDNEPGEKTVNGYADAFQVTIGRVTVCFEIVKIHSDIVCGNVNIRFPDRVEEGCQLVVILIKGSAAKVGDRFGRDIRFYGVRDSAGGNKIHFFAGDLVIVQRGVDDLEHRWKLVSGENRTEVKDQTGAEVFIDIFRGHKKHILS